MTPADALAVRLRLDFEDFRLELDHAFALDGITVVFGPSGCGKTTLLRVVAGLERRARGRIVCAGDVWQDEDGRFVPAHARGVGMVFQDARLFPHLRVDGNLRYAERRARRGAGPGGAPARAEATSPSDAIDRASVVRGLDLAPLLGRRPGSLSAGERQRVAIGRTLLARPRVLLMDEPVASLDVGRKAEILPYVARLPRVFGVPVVYVTHSIDEVTQLADRILVLGAGRKVADGDVADVLARLDLGAATGRFEASTVLEATVVGHDPRYHLTRLDVAGQSLVMPEAGFEPGTRVRLRLRARDVALATSRPERVSIRNVLSGHVAEIRAEPTTAFAETAVDVGGVQVRARITREAADALGLAPGTPVFALIKSIAVDRGVRLPDAGEADEKPAPAPGGCAPPTDGPR
jgi:molybdate transport system ATP-binding protein